ncbi:O-antigen ligase family protein [Patescibacteria group bacterium]|nr:O-antigen ligase family protein [Patescibacteria group bacterium]
MIKDIARWVALGGIFVLPFLPLIVANSLFFPFITGKNFSFRILVEVIFAAWVILACADSRYRVRFSYILASFGAFLGIMAVANALGVSPEKSFWSNYERMDGYVTLFHLGLYLLVAGSVLHAERLWNAFWNTSLVVAVFMTLYGFCQLSGSASCPISQSDFRIDGRMGNAAYLAIYMLFHFFMSLFLLVRTNSTGLRVLYGVLSLSFVFILFQTATRGTALALVGGVFLSALYIAIFERKYRIVRYGAIGSVAAVVLLVAIFLGIRNTEFVQSDRALSRIAAISFKELDTRLVIWSLALEGVKERPLLGWGQENFNYVFNQHYKASLYGQEPWFDRVHNLALDWLIAGGVLGFLAYAAILLSSLYYLLIRPFTHRDEETFSVMERGILFGLLSAYIAHTLLVFDNLISYFFLVSVLAMIHTRYGKEIPSLSRVRLPQDVIQNIIAPVTVVVLLIVVYVVNAPGLNAASDLIKTFETQNVEERLMLYERALNRGSFADQEIREQLVRAAQTVAISQDLPLQIYQANPRFTEAEVMKRAGEIRGAYIALAESELSKQLEETPNDVRILVFQASFYRSIGKFKEAIELLDRAVALSPEKQAVLFELGLAQMESGDTEGSKLTFKRAFDLEPQNTQARMFYASSAIYTNDAALLAELITPEYRNAYLESDVVLRTLYNAKRYDEVIEMLELRIAEGGPNTQLFISLAAAQNDAGKYLDAIATLEKAALFDPAFKAQSEAFIAQVRAGIKK